MHFAVQGNATPGMRTRNRLIVRAVAEVLTIEVLFQFAVAVERPQAFFCGQTFVAKTENTLGGFACKREEFGQSWRRVLFFKLGVRRGVLSMAEIPAFL